MKDIWSDLKEDFDEKLARPVAVAVKDSDESLVYAYPAENNILGYYIDAQQGEKRYYEQLFTFKIWISNLITRETSTMTDIVRFKNRAYSPSLIKHRLSCTNCGLEAEDMFARVIDNSFTWEIRFSGRTVQTFHYCFYPILECAGMDKIRIDREKSTVAITKGTTTINFKVTFSSFGTYDTFEQLEQAIKTGCLSKQRNGKKYLVLCKKLKIGPRESKYLRIGLSLNGPGPAQRAYAVKDIVNPIKGRWNQWFKKLPHVPFRNEKEKNAYYKCWWTLKLNHYRHPVYGHIIIESLPIYRGIAAWAIPAIEWVSSHDKKQPGSAIKTTIDSFFANQRADGYLDHAICIDELAPAPVSAKGWRQQNITQTPNIALACLRYYYRTRNKKSLEQWYKPLINLYEWLSEERDHKLRNWHLWAIISSHDTGLDTIPQFDAVEQGKEQYCYPTIFAAERCRFEFTMAKISSILNDGQEKKWLGKAEKTKQSLHEKLWDSSKGWFGIRHQNGRLETKVSVDGLFPFVYGLVNREQIKAAGRRFPHLIGCYGIHSFAPHQRGYNPDHYWRGPSWPATCTFAIAAASRYYPHLLQKVMGSTLNMVLLHPSIWECMNPETGEIARTDEGEICAPLMSANVGAAQIIRGILISHGFDLFSIDDITT